MAFEDVLFPNPALVHGVRKEISKITNIITNGNAEFRINKMKHYRTMLSWPSRALSEADKEAMSDFIVNRNFSLNSFKVKDPYYNTWNNTRLSYLGTGNLFLLTSKGIDDVHPIFHPDASCVVTVDGTPTAWTKQIIGGIPYINVAGTNGSSVVRITGTFYLSMRLNQATFSAESLALDSNNNISYANQGNIDLIEVFEY